MPISNDEQDRPSWQLPKGVSRGTWDYFSHKPIAQQYDDYFRDHALLAFDQCFVLETLAKRTQSFGAEGDGKRPIVVDLGCGTGRSLVPLAELGWRCLGVDLSQSMLAELHSKRVELSEGEEETLVGIRGNMVQLDWISDNSIDAVVCLFSSLGMVRGRENRVDAMRHVARILKPGGLFILHVHNRWSSLLDPGGPQWLLKTWWRSRRDSSWELGDRIYPYRGLPNMFLHIYSRRELLTDLSDAGLVRPSIKFLNRTDSGWLDRNTFFPQLRSGGFLAVAQAE